jgi:hypothetical protein
MSTGRQRNWQRHKPLTIWHSARLLLLLFLLLSLAGCKVEPQDDFAIYLVRGQLSGVDILGQPVDQLALEEQPLLTSLDIVSYDPSSHEIKLTGKAYQRIQAVFPMPVKTDGFPFVVTVGNEPVYAGAFWTPLSSLSFDGIVILQPMGPMSHLIRVELGYPNPEAFTGSDPRSDPRVLNSLEKAGKIKP